MALIKASEVKSRIGASLNVTKPRFSVRSLEKDFPVTLKCFWPNTCTLPSSLTPVYGRGLNRRTPTDKANIRNYTAVPSCSSPRGTSRKDSTSPQSEGSLDGGLSRPGDCRVNELVQGLVLDAGDVRDIDHKLDHRLLRTRDLGRTADVQCATSSVQFDFSRTVSALNDQVFWYHRHLKPFGAKIHSVLKCCFKSIAGCTVKSHSFKWNCLEISVFSLDLSRQCKARHCRWIQRNLNG